MGRRGPQPFSAAEHRRRGNFRTDRHQEPAPYDPDPGPAAPVSGPACEYVSDTDRQAVLAELEGIGHAVAADWLQTHVGWDALSLHLVKLVGLSASRLDALIDDGETLNIDEIRKEVACYTTLIAALRSEE